MYYGEKVHHTVGVVQAIVTPHLECSIQTWRPCHKKDIDKPERGQLRTTKLIPELKHLCYKRHLLE